MVSRLGTASQDTRWENVSLSDLARPGALPMAHPSRKRKASVLTALSLVSVIHTKPITTDGLTKLNDKY
jgi:hypothetical protein